MKYHDFFNTGRIFTLEVFIQKGVEPEGSGGRKGLYTYLLIYSMKLTYLLLTTVLVYGSSRHKYHEKSYSKFKQKP